MLRAAAMSPTHPASHGLGQALCATPGQGTCDASHHLVASICAPQAWHAALCCSRPAPARHLHSSPQQAPTRSSSTSSTLHLSYSIPLIQPCPPLCRLQHCDAGSPALMHNMCINKALDAKPSEHVHHTLMATHPLASCYTSCSSRTTTTTLSPHCSAAGLLSPRASQMLQLLRAPRPC